ncbi:hypothetical protein Tco_1256784 [Tanacetum coccineum]
MATFEILDELTVVADSHRLQDRMKVCFVQKRGEEEAFAGFLRDQCADIKITNSKNQRLITELEALGERGDAVRCLDHMREIVRRDSAKLVVSEQLLAGTHAGIGLKDSYVADMEENEVVDVVGKGGGALGALGENKASTHLGPLELVKAIGALDVVGVFLNILI